MESFYANLRKFNGVRTYLIESKRHYGTEGIDIKGSIDLARRVKKKKSNVVSQLRNGLLAFWPPVYLESLFVVVIHFR